MEFLILGPLQVREEGAELSLGGPQERELLALLVVGANHTVSVDRLIDELWPDEPPKTARNIVQRYVSNLRRELGEAGASRLITEHSGYSLRLEDGDWVDALRFVELVERGEKLATENPPVAVSHLDEALALWRGPLLGSGEAGTTMSAEATRLDELRLQATEARVEAELALGRHRGLVAELEGLVQRYPLRERLRSQLMMALYRSGRQADALRVYTEAKQLLGEELGLEPSPDLASLEGQILLRDPALDLEAVAPPSPDLPTGAVTFLFAANDEGVFDAIRHSVQRNHGFMFRDAGVQEGAAFVSAPQALSAALSAGLAMGGDDSTGGLRMALHTGTAFPQDGDYADPAVERTVSLLEAAHPGQILVSSTTADLSRDTLGGAVGLADVGSYLIGSSGRPENVYQLYHEDLPTEFPPLAAPRQASTNLPAAISSFVGRAAELDEVEALLEDSRLVTLVGAGGAGKTRLALETAGRVIDGYPDGVWLVELATITLPDLFAATVARALGIRPQAAVPTIDTVLGHLRHRRLLLMLDNCEHLVEAAASFSARALRECPGLTILATSRERLAVDGETVWTIPPMTMPDPTMGPESLLEADAIRLLADRGAQARSGFQLDATNTTAATVICRRLDGLPLAIELAAARLRVLSVEELAGLLDDRFDVLTAGTRSADPRHQTLRAAVDWSYRLLSDEERATFRGLTVFAGGLGVEAAAAVVAPKKDNAEVIETLQRLVDKSLLVAEPGGDNASRFRLLETLRRYGYERLVDEGEEDRVLHRHAGYFLDLAETARDRVRGPDQRLWFQRLEVEHNNMRKALEWTLDSGDVETATRIVVALRESWHVHGHWREGRHWLDRCLEGSSELSPMLQAEAHHAAGVFAALRRDYDQAMPHLEAALAIYLDVDDTAGIADVSFDLAQAVARHGDYPRASSMLEESCGLYKEVGDRRGVAECNCVLAQLAVRRGDHDSATELASEARAIAEEIGDHYGVSWGVLVLAERSLAHNDLDAAETLFAQTLVMAEEIGNAQFVANGLQGLGQVEVARGHCERASELLGKSLRINWDVGDTLFVAGGLSSMAELAMACGDDEQAARLWGAEEALRATIATPPPPPRQGAPHFERVASELRSQAADRLGEDAFAAAVAEGATMDASSAVALALGVEA
jgi:predicted ATPase/DNA-binding SARP family transcriptional activator